MVNKIVTKFHELNHKYWKIADVVTFVTVLLLGFGLWYLFTHETTDDAFIEGDVTIISPQVSGHIENVYINDNQTVKAKDPLCDIDDRDYQNSFSLAKADLEAKQVEAQQAGEDIQRYQKLLASKDISQQQYDKALLRWNTDKAQVAAAGAREAQASLNLSYAKIMAPADGVVTRKDV